MWSGGPKFDALERGPKKRGDDLGPQERRGDELGPQERHLGGSSRSSLVEVSKGRHPVSTETFELHHSEVSLKTQVETAWSFIADKRTVRAFSAFASDLGSGSASRRWKALWSISLESRRGVLEDS